MQGCSGEQGRTGKNLPAQVDFQCQRTRLGSQEAALIARFVRIYPCFTAAPSQAAGRWLRHPSVHLEALFLLVFSGVQRGGLFLKMVVSSISLQVQLQPQETGVTHTDVRYLSIYLSVCLSVYPT